MEVGVRIEAQDPSTRRGTHAGSCYLTYVALDEKGKPTPVPPLKLSTATERRRFREAAARRKLREAENAVLREA